MGSPKTSVEVWHSRALAVNAKWLTIPNGRRHKGKLLCLKCRNEWETSGEVIQAGSGCPECAKDSPISKADWDVRAKDVNAVWVEYPKTTKSKARLRCVTCDHQWIEIGNNIQQGHGCPMCAKNWIRVPKNEWEFRVAAINASFIEFPHGERSSCKLLCAICGQKWRSDGSRISKGHGCPACANHGYSPNKPGSLYVLDFGNGQIGYGISNFPDDRLKTHSKRIAFDNYRLWDFDDGRVPEKIENSIKRQYATAFHVDLKIDGFRTEAVDAWPFAEFCKFVDMLIESEVAHA